MLSISPPTLHAAGGKKADDLMQLVLYSYSNATALSNTTSIVAYGTALNLTTGRKGRFTLYAMPQG